MRCQICDIEKKCDNFKAIREMGKYSKRHLICRLCVDIEHTRKKEKRELNTLNRRLLILINRQKRLIKNSLKVSPIRIKVYNFNDKTSRNEYMKVYHKTRRKFDINYKLRYYLRIRLSKVIKYQGSAITNLGCSVEFLRNYLESKFKPGMTWDNWSQKGWHIDHIRPLSSFNLTNPAHFKKANHYTNLQPLWAIENLQKSNKI